MNSSTDLAPDIRVRGLRMDKDQLTVDLMDGRTITVPLAWYPRLFNATARQRRNWEIAGAGFGIHWPDIDEDLSTEGLLRGAPAPHAEMRPRRRPGRSAARRGSNAQLVEAVLQEAAPRRMRPAEVRETIQRDKGVAIAFTSIRSALNQLEARHTAEPTGDRKTWRFRGDRLPQGG